MLTTIIFSKDRPLQLQATLESLFFCGGPVDVRVIYCESAKVSYSILEKRFPQVRWVKETDFAVNLGKEIRDALPYILFLCDDVYLTREFDAYLAIQALNENPLLFGFSLRLGNSILSKPPVSTNSGVMSWNWLNTIEKHWNYPWEVSASIYRKSDVQGFLSCVDPPRNPNFFEASIAELCRRKKLGLERPFLACFTESCSLTLTVNRVQETHPNDFDARKPTSVEDLYNAFLSGKKLAWKRFLGSRNPVIHVDSSYFELEDSSFSLQVTELPKISTICFVYNRARYVAETVESVLGQDYPNIEMIVLDDGSTDGTSDILQRYMLDRRFRYQKQENIGRNLDRFDELNNRAIALTTGEYLCFIGADDVFLHTKASTQARVLNDNPNVGIVFSNAIHINEDGLPTGGDFRKQEVDLFNNSNSTRLLIKTNYIAHPSVMLRKSIYNQLGGFQTPFAADYDFWLRASLITGLHYVDQKLFKYRIHNESSSNCGNSSKSFVEGQKVSKEFYSKCSLEQLFPDLNSHGLNMPEVYARIHLGNYLVHEWSLLNCAKQEYLKAYEIFPQLEQSWNNLAVMLALEGKIAEGLKILQDGLAVCAGSQIGEHNLKILENPFRQIGTLQLLSSGWPVP